MIVIGLTGGIGSGKTQVAKKFAKLGAPVIISDELAQEAISPGTDGLKKIVEKLGENILTPDKALDREKLRRKIFSNPALKKWLEALVHPEVCEKIRIKLAQIDAPYVIVEIPLLIESQHMLSLDRVLVITCPENLRIKRIQERSQLTVSEIKQIIQNQVSEQQLINIADDIIHNDQDFQYLYQQIESLDKKYLQLAAEK